MSIGDKEEKGKEEEIIEEDFDIVPISDNKVVLPTSNTSKKTLLFNVILVVLVATASFGLGRLSLYEDQKMPVRVLNNESSKQVFKENVSNVGEVKGVSVSETVGVDDSGGEVVASKNGTKYHYPWCGGAKQIADKNKITFKSTEEARKAGYTPAANCKGLK